MCNAKSPGMQEQSTEAIVLHFLVEFTITVLVVARKRVAAAGGMDADLVGAPGVESGSHQLAESVVRADAEHSARMLAVRCDNDHAFTRGQRVFAQCRSDFVSR